MSELICFENVTVVICKKQIYNDIDIWHICYTQTANYRSTHMNGELFQICMIVNAARKALTAASCCDVEIDGFVDHTEFRFLPEKALFHTKEYIAHSAGDWFSHCQEHGLADIKMLCPVKTDDRTILGYVNTTGSSIVTFYPSSRITFWTAHWEFIPDRKKWKVLYTEHSWDNAPREKITFEDNTVQFNKILTEISEFADEIDFSGFGDIFRSAGRILNGTEEIPLNYPNREKISLPELSEAKKRMFYAASKADVFGAMGSWNDSPPWYAEEKGLGGKYDQLSDELLKQIRLAILYSINEN